MNFDQMMDAWKAQDEAPLYGVNGDLLQLVLQHEQSELRRQLRREQWVTYGVGAGMAALGGAFLWAFVTFGGPVPYAVGAAAGMAAFVLWMAALWVSLRRQRRRERQFGNSLREEIARNLSLVDYQLSRYGRWGSAILWSAPVLVGAGLIYWLSVEINLDEGESRWDQAWMMLILLWAVVFPTQASSRAVRQKLEPRRQRLSELSAMLETAE